MQVKKRAGIIILIAAVCVLAVPLRIKSREAEVAETMAVGKGVVKKEDTVEEAENMDDRKIAITFDGDVIIGSSQRIDAVRDGQDRTESNFISHLKTV